MDDLDHSMHIAEYDWKSFYEESEECCLLQPSLACLDNLSLSDSENSDILSPVFSTSQQETHHDPDSNGVGAKNSDAGCRTEEESYIKLLVQMNTCSSGGEQVEVTAGANEGSVTQVGCGICFNCPAGNTFNTKGVHVKTAEDTEKTTDNIKNTCQTELSHVQSSEVSSELKIEDGDLQGQTDNSRNEPDSVFCHPTHTTQETGSENVSSVAARAEKERWFVTVNDRPSRQRVPASSVKKKLRQKKLCTNKCISRQEQSLEKSFKINRGKNECKGGRDMKGFIQSNLSLLQNSGRPSSASKNPECTSDTSQMPCEDEKMSQKVAISYILKKTETEPTMHRNTHELASSASRSDETFNPKDPSNLESLKSDELEDGVEFFSVHSYDSENYWSAAESVDESPHPLIDHPENQQLLSLTTKNLLKTGDTRDREIHSCDSTLSCNMSPTNCCGCKSTSVESTLAFPSGGQRANKMPDVNSTCDNDTHSTGLCRPSYTLTRPKQEINILASGGTSGHKLSPLPVPDLTVTPCSVANSPETYARAAGHSRPVYAISPFWDEMEKLTINDILQLRMSSRTSLRETEETVTRNVDDSPPNHSFLVGTMDNNLPAGRPMDTSDMADSDYFTQPDECKPDSSSCEFSDFEEEYWQLLGASRNTSPDPQGKNQEEESLSICSEEKETPVPLEDFAGRCLEDHESHTLSKLSWPKPITKGKKVHNVQTLKTEDISLHSLCGNNEGNVTLSGRQSLDENMVLKVKDTLETRIPAPVLFSTNILDNHYQISIPEVFEYFFTDDKGNDSRFVTICDFEDVSQDSVFDSTLCSVRDEISFSSLHDSQQSGKKPIPIFSCSPPTVRELTLQKVDYVFLKGDCEEKDICGAFTEAGDCDTHRSCLWKSLLSMRKICFHDKGIICCGRSGAWEFPFEPEKTKMRRNDRTNAVLTEGRVSSAPTPLFRALKLQQRILETIRTSLCLLQEETASSLHYSSQICVWSALLLPPGC
ncbi:uncharacterized protein perm1b isoform X2 [Channa argus]|uniref:uncharacterized protein perm1b isoform X2 n=1 Tax=Channa argus TaxID=215402 RepID=UPI003522923B